MNIGVFFGSTTGNTEDIAELIEAHLTDLDTCPNVHVHNIADASVHLMENYPLIICGMPTWDYGELQADWEDIWEELTSLDLQGVTFAVFGCGDQIGYPEWFQDAIGMLHDKLKAQGGKPIGYWPAEGYRFERSKAFLADSQEFVGLPIDEDNQHELTQERVDTWCGKLLEDYSQAGI